MAMKVSQWTSSYNDQFRDKNNVISPNAGESMHHFPGHYDPSHYQRDPGFYGTRAQLASTAKFASTQNGQQVRIPVRGDGPVGYGEAPKRDSATSRTHSFYAPPPENSTQNFSALRQQTITGLNTQRIPLEPQGGFGNSVRLDSMANGSSSQQFGGAATQRLTSTGGPLGPASFGDKNLWSHPILAHGDKSSYGPSGQMTQRFGASMNGTNGQQQAFGATNGSQSARFGTTTAPYYQGYQRGATQGVNGAYTSAESANMLTGLVDPAFVDQPDQWRYDARGAAMAKDVDLRRNTDPRNKYLIPGYSGFIRGKQFEFGQTFGKMTRICMDVPLDLPTDVDN